MLANGTLLQNRYLIKRPLAQGGMGTVYEAEAIHLGHAQVAVKETFFTQEWLREQFKREASMLARLRHNALPKVSDHFVEDTGQFLVMEFIPGHDLDGLLSEKLKNENKPFEWRQVMQWADRLLDALEYIHNQQPPIIHRDIKPQNLKLTPSGDLFLIDFGLAKDANASTKAGGRSVHGFTLNYAPPEQIKASGTDARSDLYSLGATLHHLLSGEIPESAKVREEVIRYDVPDPLRPIHEINEEVPEILTEMIARSMKLDRTQRYQSAADMREALRWAVQNVERTPSGSLRRANSGKIHSPSADNEPRHTQDIADRPPKAQTPQPDTLIVTTGQMEKDSRREEDNFNRKRKKEIERRNQAGNLTRGQSVRTSPDYKPNINDSPAPPAIKQDDSQTFVSIESLRKKARIRISLIAVAAVLILLSLAYLLWLQRERNAIVQTPLVPSPSPGNEIAPVEKLRYWFELEG
ncbi:MAG TPA: serine/threonine-protein kinase, partial [Blastocatellia bacterium]|nr:serine/threonine-protein kinase [Blastocatellia bacterium]